MSDSEDDAAFASADEGEPEATAVSKSAPGSESKTKDTKREKKVSEDNNDKTDSKSGNTSKSSVNEKKKETKTAVASKSKESVKSEVPPSKKQEEKSKGGKGKKKRGKQTKAETASQNSGGKPETNSAGDTEENLQKKDEPTIDSSEIERKLKISDSGKSTVSETISSDDKIIAPETKEAKESHSEEANLNVKSTVTEEKITTEVKRDEQLTSDKERKEISKGDQEAKAAFDRLSQPSKQKVVYNLLKYETQFKLYLCIYFP